VELWRHQRAIALLVEVPQVFVQNYVVQLAKGRQGRDFGLVQFGTGAPTKQVTIEIPEAGVRQSATADASGAPLSFRREAGFMGAGGIQNV